MDERGMQFRVGAMVLGSIGAGILLLFFFYSSPSLLQDDNTIYIRFTEAPGVKKGTPVRKSGVLVGRVADVALRDKQQDVLVTVELNPKYPIHQNEIVQVSTETLLGDSMLEFVPTGSGPPGPPITDGALLNGQVDRGAMEAIENASKALNVVVELEGDFKNTLTEFRTSAEKFGALSDHLDTITTNNEDQLRRIVQKSEQAMDSFNLAMISINQVVADEDVRENLKTSLAAVPQMVTDTQIAMQKLGVAADRANTTLEGAEGLLEGAAGLTQSLGKVGGASEDMSAQLKVVLTDLEDLTRDLLLITSAVNEQKGTLGQLVYNPDLYQRLNRAADNVEQVTFRMKPVVEDVRVFTDKIARDPGQLGVKGIFNRSNTGTKFLPMGIFQQPPQPSPDYQYQWYPDRVTPTYVQPSPMPPPAPCCEPTSPQTFWQSQ